jgi:tetratricopeptide (TPR) repeat protein
MTGAADGSPGLRLRAAVCLALAFLLMAGWAAAYARLQRMSSPLIQVSGSGLRGLFRYLAGDYAGAARAYREARRGVWAHYGVDRDGGLALAGGDPVLAERRARTTLALVPGAVGPRITLAELALDAGRYDEARDLLASGLARQPDDGDAAYLAAVVAARQGRDGEAIDLLNRALARGSSGRPTILFHMLGTRCSPPSGPPRQAAPPRTGSLSPVALGYNRSPWTCASSRSSPGWWSCAASRARRRPST